MMAAADKNPNQGGSLLGMPMSPTDVRLVSECRRDSFYQRCLPLMIGASTATHFLVKANKLSPHIRYGSFFKVCWAAFFGHLIGKISYQSKCNEILKAEPNSLIGRSIRQRLGLPTLEPTDPQVVEMIERMEKGGGGGNPNVTDDSSATASSPSTPGYDEMRRLNRLGVPPQQQHQQHYPQQQQPQQQQPPSSDLPTPIDDRPGLDEIPPEERPMNKRMPIPKRNKYGDVIEED